MLRGAFCVGLVPRADGSVMVAEDTNTYSHAHTHTLCVCLSVLLSFVLSFLSLSRSNTDGAVADCGGRSRHQVILDDLMSGTGTGGHWNRWSFCLSVLSVCQSVCPSFCLSICLSLCRFVCLSVHLLVCHVCTPTLVFTLAHSHTTILGAPNAMPDLQSANLHIWTQGPKI